MAMKTVHRSEEGRMYVTGLNLSNKDLLRGTLCYYEKGGFTDMPNNIFLGILSETVKPGYYAAIQIYGPFDFKKKINMKLSIKQKLSIIKHIDEPNYQCNYIESEHVTKHVTKVDETTVFIKAL